MEYFKDHRAHDRVLPSGAIRLAHDLSTRTIAPFGPVNTMIPEASIAGNYRIDSK